MSAIATSDEFKIDEIFNFDDADITLCSSDGVHFSVHRCILRKIAPFFADMLSLPQPGQTADVHTSVDMAEDAVSLRLFLGCCYPRIFCPEPKLDDVVDIKRAAAMARKFDSVVMNTAVQAALARYSQDKPEVAYAIAWQYELKDSLRAAARACLNHGTFLNEAWDISGFEEVPATSLAQLYRYHTTAAAVLQPLCDSETGIGWISYGDITLVAPACSDEQLNVSFLEDDNGEGTPHALDRGVFKWWWTFVTDVIAAVQGSNHPQLHAAFDQAFQKMMTGTEVCTTCRAGVRWYAVMQSTREKLHKEIERRLSEIPLKTPF